MELMSGSRNAVAVQKTQQPQSSLSATDKSSRKRPPTSFRSSMFLKGGCNHCNIQTLDGEYSGKCSSQSFLLLPSRKAYEKDIKIDIE